MLPAGCGGLFEAIRALTGNCLNGERPSGFSNMVHWKPRFCIAMGVGLLQLTAESRWSLHTTGINHALMINA